MLGHAERSEGVQGGRTMALASGMVAVAEVELQIGVVAERRWKKSEGS